MLFLDKELSFNDGKISINWSLKRIKDQKVLFFLNTKIGRDTTRKEAYFIRNKPLFSYKIKSLGCCLLRFG
jgi:hypothetical protein